jgi:hypothetical protein
MYWFEEYIGKPWQPVPDPPRSFTCGHLGRWIYQERLGIDTPLSSLLTASRGLLFFLALVPVSDYEVAV